MCIKNCMGKRTKTVLNNSFCRKCGHDIYTPIVIKRKNFQYTARVVICPNCGEVLSVLITDFSDMNFRNKLAGEAS